MAKNKKIIKIETRTHLLSTLAEAAEFEHTLMCLYIYAVFSLKQSTQEDISTEELKAIQRWKSAIVEVAIQEMTHLALVANLTTQVGGTAHFHRPDFPVRMGYFPSDFVIEPAPFDSATLDHFIFLERPEGKKMKDSQEFFPDTEYERLSPRGRIMAHTGHYETVGQIYEAIAEGIEYLTETLHS